MRLFVDDGKVIGGRAAEIETVAPCDQYTLQGDAFSRVVRGEIALPYGVEDAICNMRVIDALFSSENSGGWVKLAVCAVVLIPWAALPTLAANSTRPVGRRPKTR